jgi:hypothetical protein
LKIKPTKAYLLWSLSVGDCLSAEVVAKLCQAENIQFTAEFAIRNAQKRLFAGLPHSKKWRYGWR